MNLKPRQLAEALDVIRSLRGSDRYNSMVANLLQDIDPSKPLGTDLFGAVARLSWSMAFEAVALRVNPKTHKIEVYLRQRSAEEPAYPSQWHAPGSVRRPGESWRHVADRLEKEFGVPIVDFKEVNTVDTAEARGSFESSIFLVTLDSHRDPREDDRHRWFPMDALPEGMVDIHRDQILPIAFEWFKNFNHTLETFEGRIKNEEDLSDR